MPASGGTAAEVAAGVVLDTYDDIALPAGSGISPSSTKYLVDEGTADGSSLSIFDTATGTNKVVVSGIPGASTSIAFNPTNNSVYVGDGYDYGGGTTGDIRGFSLSLIGSAYNSGTPILFASVSSFDSAGTGYQCGEGMFFDNNGYLFSGGWQGITVFRPNGSISYNSSNLTGALTYDPANNEVLVPPPYGSFDGHFI